MIFLDALIVNVALPAIQSDFKVGEAGLQWVVTAYSIGMTIAIMSSGTAADIYGRRKLYLAGIALFTAASAACGMASSLEALNLARAIQGVAAATVNVTSLALVSAAFPDPKLKSWAIGIWTAVASIRGRSPAVPRPTGRPRRSSIRTRPWTITAAASPLLTDLIATGLGTCMVTVMGIHAGSSNGSSTAPAST